MPKDLCVFQLVYTIIFYVNEQIDLHPHSLWVALRVLPQIREAGYKRQTPILHFDSVQFSVNV